MVVLSMLNKVAGYRKMLGLSQEEMANLIGISYQAYSKRENNKIPFTDQEKVKFKSILREYFPNITIDEIFF